jgi:hypothetical protein
MLSLSWVKQCPLAREHFGIGYIKRQFAVNIEAIMEFFLVNPSSWPRIAKNCYHQLGGYNLTVL